MDSLSPYANNGNIPTKKCTGPCGRVLPATSEFFHRHKRNKDGLHFDCKECACLAAREYSGNHPEEQKERNKKRYWSNPEQARAEVKDYYQGHAEERKAYSQEYRESHPDQITAYNQQYYQDNRDREIARAMAYYTAHPEQKQKHREWLEENVEAVKAYSVKYAIEHAEQIEAYRKTHPEIMRARQARRRTRKTQAGGSFTAQEWEGLKAKYGYCCLCCGKCEPEITLHADHVIPVSKLGTSNIENIQPLCERCNKVKGRKATDYRLSIEREA